MAKGLEDELDFIADKLNKTSSMKLIAALLDEAATEIRRLKAIIEDTQGDDMTVTEDEINTIVRRWCPPVFIGESKGVRVIRALLNLHACVLDQRRALNGKEPIRDLGSYPRD